MNKKLHIGTGGVPLSATARDTIAGIKRVSELGLDLMELEFVHGVRMSEEKAVEVRKVAEESGVVLTIHAPYYINLNAVEPEKREASRQRIIDSCRIGQIVGAKSVCFHAGFKLGQEDGQVFDSILHEMNLIEEELEKNNIQEIFLSPELTGKETQFGSIEELLILADQLEKTKLCIDFAHHFARNAGKENGYDAFERLLAKLEESNSELKNNLHMHISGINYSAKGERNHMKLEDSHFEWRAVVRLLKEKNIGGYLVCESPVLEEDALLIKEYYENI